MGGGTGTGASHVSKAAREMNILTVGVTTLPSLTKALKNEKSNCYLDELKKHLDTTTCAEPKSF